MKVKELLSVLINSSEKAARIARLCRSNQHLFSLLIEEKTGEEKNERFFQDFKTLADVLIQAMISHDVAEVFPALKESVRGEESNKFENALGEKITIEINSPKQTYDMLLRVLDQNVDAASELSKELHNSLETEEARTIPQIENDEIEDNDVEIIIDPIDATQEYIAGGDVPSEFPNIFKSGLKCATVLIGVYSKRKNKGSPFLGVINQPFALESADGSFASKIFYGGVLDENVKFSNVSRAESVSNLAIISSSEAVKTNSFKTVAAAGAGYKALQVIQGHADIYYLSKGSTFKWDTCACQAILMAIGGDIVEMSSSVKLKRAVPLKYGDEEDKCNRNGLIAFRNSSDFDRLVNEMASSI